MASMLSRSSSSRRRRASRSAASPQRSLRSLAAPEPAASTVRRASIADVTPSSTTKGDFPPGAQLVPELLRTSPRNSLTPECVQPGERSRSARNSLVSDGRSLLAPDPHLRRSHNSLAPTYDRSPRNSISGDANRVSSRNNLTADFNRSPRNSLVPEHDRSARNSLVPEGMNRSARNSLVPEHDRSARNSLVPEYDRSPRNSLVPDYDRSPRKSLVPEYDRSPRNSLVPEFDRSARNSLVPDFDRSARNSIVPEYDRSARNSIVPEAMNRSPRGSLVPEHDRSPRGSLVPDGKRVSPRGSITGDLHDRSPRHSMSEASRSPRGSIVPGDFSRSPRASIVPDSTYLRSPRTSLGDGRTGPTISFESSVRGGETDLAVAGPSGMTRSPSPYRLSVTPRGAQINLGYNGLDPNSRRASSNVSQVSADDRRRLCERSKLSGAVGVLRLTAYGSVVYQLKDANMEASGTFDFVLRALRIVYKTVAVTVLLICLTSLPLLMLIMGIQFLKDCPLEPRLPIYMLVGGCTGVVRMCWALYSQIKSRRYERLDLAVPVANLEDGFLTPSAGARVASFALNAFLLTWFILGNVWVANIYWPEFHPTLFEPNRWCSKTLYVFALVHLGIVYSLIAVLVLFIFGLMVCQLFSCPLLRRYK